jgi:hypothetical protein
MTCASKVVIGVKSTAAADELPLLKTDRKVKTG